MKNKIYYINLILLVLKVFYSVSKIIIINDVFSKIITLYILITFFIHLALNCLNHKYITKRALLYVFLALLFTYSSYVAHDYNLLLTYFLVIFAEEIDIKKAFKIIFVINLTLLIFHVFIYCLNHLIAIIQYTPYFNKDGEIRHNFFLGHPNYFSSILLSTYAIFAYLKYEKLNFIYYGIGIFLAIFVYIFPHSRTTAFSIIIFEIFILISKYSKKEELVISKFLSKYLFLILSILSAMYLLLYTYFNTDLKLTLSFIDNLISGRLWYSYNAYKQYGLTLFGQSVDYSSIFLYNTKLILDNLYVKLFINYGIVYAFVTNLIIIKYNKYLDKKDYPFIIIFAITCFFESHNLNACIGIALLILGKKILTEKKGENKNEKNITTRTT